ncbi:uncharacterized protein METZ01_LOCUS94851 [marine metagenome]|uniref:Uncharacterized protein n=1 Tax=marine metagenome TaxID=408172 RepID=A0A381VQS6_9ZZZZ
MASDKIIYEYCENSMTHSLILIRPGILP